MTQWQSNQPLPGSYRWGYARRSRHQAAFQPVRCHVVLDDVQMLCTGGLALYGNGGGDPCPKCVALVRDQMSE